MLNVCKYCNEEFKVEYKCRKTKFCSRKCYWNSKKGKYPLRGKSSEELKNIYKRLSEKLQGRKCPENVKIAVANANRNRIETFIKG